MKLIKHCLFFLLFILLSFQSIAQSLPVGTPVLEEYYRRGQLMGKFDSTVSFTIRPLYSFASTNAFYPDSADVRESFGTVESSWRTEDGKGKVQLLPPSMQIQMNSHHPYGWNDGAMIPAKGFQTLISAGVYAEYGPLSLQIMPELVFATNPGFDTFDKDHYDVIAARYYDFYNNIDLPARFGTSAYGKAFLGQSSLRFNFKGLSAGFSTENLWWGPGRRNSLLMSNNAPGFLHATLNTIKPIKSPIGSFEGQVIGGRLLGSGYGVLEPEREYFDNPLFVPKPKGSRYISGYALTWQPKWIEGLFLGMTRSSQMYRADMHNFGDLLPFHSSAERVTADQPLSIRDIRNSYFMRWLWAEEQAEFYFEFGRNNNNNDSRELLLTPDRSRAYIAGLRKVFPFNQSRGESFIVNVEVAQMQETFIEDVRNTNSWYINKYVRHGYTHRGQVLGAGIGPGGNMQSLDVSWFKGVKRLGFQLERYVHNNDLYYYAFEDSRDYRRHWTDLSFAAIGEWNYNNLLFNAKLQGIKSLNYQWFLLQEPGQPYMTNGRDAFNLQIQAGVMYRF